MYHVYVCTYTYCTHSLLTLCGRFWLSVLLVTAQSFRWRCCMPLKCSATTTPSPKVSRTHTQTHTHAHTHARTRTHHTPVYTLNCEMRCIVMRTNSFCFPVWVWMSVWYTHTCRRAAPHVPMYLLTGMWKKFWKWLVCSQRVCLPIRTYLLWRCWGIPVTFIRMLSLCGCWVHNAVAD